MSDDGKMSEEVAKVLLDLSAAIHRMDGRLESAVKHDALAQILTEFRRDLRSEWSNEIEKRDRAQVTRMEQTATGSSRKVLGEYQQQEDRMQRRARWLAVAGGGAGLASAFGSVAMNFFGGS